MYYYLHVLLLHVLFELTLFFFHSSFHSSYLDEGGESDKDFDYLLSMPLWNLTMEKVNKLKNERDEKDKQVKELESTGKCQFILYFTS